MRVVREQPRLATAKALGLLCLAAFALVLGLSLGGNSGADASDDAARTVQLRLTAVEQTLEAQSDRLQQTRAKLERSRRVRARTSARLRAAQRSNVKLRRDLRRVRRALIRARE